MTCTLRFLCCTALALVLGASVAQAMEESCWEMEGGETVGGELVCGRPTTQKELRLCLRAMRKNNDRSLKDVCKLDKIHKPVPLPRPRRV
jgi:hypothetical protein